MTEELKHKIHKEATKYVEDDRRVTRSEYTAYLAGAEAMYAELVPLLEWVSVEDRLPEQGQDCLFKSEKSIYVGFYDYSVFRTFDRNIVREDVTHWRRIEL